MDNETSKILANKGLSLLTDAVKAPCRVSAGSGLILVRSVGRRPHTISHVLGRLRVTKGLRSTTNFVVKSFGGYIPRERLSLRLSRMLSACVGEIGGPTMGNFGVNRYSPRVSIPLNMVTRLSTTNGGLVVRDNIGWGNNVSRGGRSQGV